jgi:AraC-like DNA-binding protein
MAGSHEVVSDSPITHRALRRMCAFIHQHHAQAVTLDQIAAHAGLSKFYVVRLFKRHLGITPHAYLVMVRLVRAQALLRAGWSATDTAHELGFCDQSHFIRRFRQATGTTPAAFQQRH